MPVRTLLSEAGSAAGSALRGLSAGLTRLRSADKPLHPRGVLLEATVHRFGSDEKFGVPFLDEPGTDPALVRFSRGGGLPAALPDVLGIALRIDPAGRSADLLFSTTGRGPLGRFLLVPRRAEAISATTHSTLQPYRTPTGPVVLAATPTVQQGRTVIKLAAARPTGRWQEFGAVVVDAQAGAGDAPISFDPFLNPVPGLENYGWARRVREGAYAAARRSRRRRDRRHGAARVSDLSTG
jgi:hypothetical protein